MAATKERDQVLAENDKLKHKLDALTAALEAKTGKSADTGITLPESYDELPDWIETNFPGRVVLHGRAVRGLKSPQFEDAIQSR